MKLLSLQERTERHPQLLGRKYPTLPVAEVEQRLAAAGAKFVGKGSFCRVWRLENFDLPGSPAYGKAVAVKVTSASFKGLTGKELIDKQRYLTGHWYREVNAHLVLHGEPRVTKVFHVFSGSMMVPPIPAGVPGDEVQEPRKMQVVGMIEEYCNEGNLSDFQFKMASFPWQKLSYWTLDHVAAEFAELMTQVGQYRRKGIVHQDIKPDNILVHLPPGAGMMPQLKFGDWNGAQWEQLTLDGHSWIGTVGFMPYRVQQLYLRKQQAMPGVGEINYDCFQVGKTLLRTLLQHNDTEVAYCRSNDDLELEHQNVLGSALDMLSTPPQAGQPDRELWTFGVTICFLMCWDEPYTCTEEHLRLLPDEAAEVLDQWAGICRAWKACGSEAFWEVEANISAMAHLYLRLTELARVPPLSEPLDPEEHTQSCEYIITVLENFFQYGTAPEGRMSRVQEQAEVVLAERQAAADAAARAAATAALQWAEQRKQRPALRSTAWEQKLAERAAAEEAFLEEDSPATARKAKRIKRRKRKSKSPGGENAAPKNQAPRPALKHKAGAAEPPAPAAAKKPKAAWVGGGGAAAAAAAAAAGGAANAADLLVLGSKLRLKDVFGEDAKPGADAPQLLGPNHAVAVMLADTVRAACDGEDGMQLQLGGTCQLNFTMAARRSVKFSRQEMLALSQDPAACRCWNKFVAVALAAWQEQGKEGSLGERLRLLRRLQTA